MTLNATSRLLFLALIGLVACTKPGESARAGSQSRSGAKTARQAEVAGALANLRETERALLDELGANGALPGNLAFGANPYAVAALSGSLEDDARYALVTRGDSELLLLDGTGRVVDRQPAPRGASSVAAPRPGVLLLGGELEPTIARYLVKGRALVPEGRFQLPGARSVAALVADERAALAVDFTADRLFAWTAGAGRAQGTRAAPPPAPSSQPVCAGPVRLALSANAVAVACLFDQTIAIFSRDERGLLGPELSRIRHDGPFYGLSLLERGEELLIAAGGTEDHPLDRRDKVFGYVDSFVYLYRRRAGTKFERVSATNVSALGAVVPKVVELVEKAGGVDVHVLGYGSDRRAILSWRDGADDPAVRVLPSLPGCSDAVFAGGRGLCANPLFDAVVAFDPERSPSLQPLEATRAREPGPRERLGEALFFTTLMAPDASSEGRLSRFTCETCHFEGTSDGRVHHSGRGAVRVSTRPLLGLLASAPYFSRAHDPDLAAVAHHEFTVANRGNPVDPWFPLSSSRFPWLTALGVDDEMLSPLELRRALLAFLARFSHPESPFVGTRTRFSESERRGAELFREDCAGCHAARRVARDAASELAFAAWESAIFSAEATLVWSNGAYAKVGVEPYVDPLGTRTPSLRRLYTKRPYLTNGAAATLDELLRAARFTKQGFLHAPVERSEASRALSEKERLALAEFLRLL